MKWKMASIAAVIMVVLAGGLYWYYDYSTGNHVTVQSVLPADGANESNEGQASSDEVTEQEEPAASGEGESPGEEDAVAVGGDPADALEGSWSLTPESKVYLSVTTSRETVNIEASSVTGQWNINLSDPSQMQAQAEVDITQLDSGNSQRDGHILGGDYLNAKAYPTALFTLTSVDNLPEAWTEGETVTIDLNGTLTVKDIPKEVTFTSEAQYSEGKLFLEGSTIVTFADFGMQNPHNVVMETQNDMTVELRLILERA